MEKSTVSSNYLLSNTYEVSIEGWDKIASMFNVDRQYMLRRRKELMEAGAIFYRLKGFPPRKIVCAFPSVLKAWISKKMQKGEFL